MAEPIQHILASECIEASAPCRIDMGGTLDISCFYYPLAYLKPCTVNIAVNLRTHVQIAPYKKGYIKISSRGFDSSEYQLDHLPFDHPMGLMFAIAAYYRIDGIHIQINSQSPPRSALGGSSVAAVALTGAFRQVLAKQGKEVLADDTIPLLAHAIEESVAGVPCGLQDQLAAVYGGVNAWQWKGVGGKQLFEKIPLVPADQYSLLDKSILLAYCGKPHASKDINSRWVRQFISGAYRNEWAEIVACTREFASALQSCDFEAAGDWMNRETDIRRRLTPDVLDDTGMGLVSAARDMNCGARFCGAGGGGCLWAIGNSENILELADKWRYLLQDVEDSTLFDIAVDANGLMAS